MKKVFIILGALVITVVFILISFKVNQYSLNAEVTSVEDGVTTFTDEVGEVWACENTEECYTIGQCVRLTWNDKGTDMKQDDEIIMIETE